DGKKKNRWADFFTMKRIRNLAPDLILVNEMGSHRMMERLRSWPCRNRGVINRNAPEAASGEMRNGANRIPRYLKELHVFSHLIGVSGRVLDKWTQLDDYSSASKTVIPNCCNEVEVRQLLARSKEEVREGLGLPTNRFVAVCPASIQYRKGQDLLLKYIERMPEVLFVLVGSIPATFGGPEIREAIEASSHADRFVWVEHTPKALDYVYAADLMMLPTRSEALPRAVLEAMALKTPILTSDADGIPEMIEHGTHGHLFPVEQPEQMADALKQAMEHGPRLIGAAHERYWNEFSRTRQIERYRSWLDHALTMDDETRTTH
ncbi:MAG: glycosyltransferase family 4 protein, partial [Verrucomicrobiota bacterium]